MQVQLDRCYNCVVEGAQFTGFDHQKPVDHVLDVTNSHITDLSPLGVSVGLRKKRHWKKWHPEEMALCKKWHPIYFMDCSNLWGN